MEQTVELVEIETDGQSQYTVVENGTQQVGYTMAYEIDGTEMPVVSEEGEILSNSATDSTGAPLLVQYVDLETSETKPVEFITADSQIETIEVQETSEVNSKELKILSTLSEFRNTSSADMNAQANVQHAHGEKYILRSGSEQFKAVRIPPRQPAQTTYHGNNPIDNSPPAAWHLASEATGKSTVIETSPILYDDQTTSHVEQVDQVMQSMKMEDEVEVEESQNSSVDVMLVEMTPDDPLTSGSTVMQDGTTVDLRSAAAEFLKADAQNTDADIATVRVELNEQEYLTDMENIEILVVYYCKRCGHGDQDLMHSILHSRRCKENQVQEEVTAKVNRALNLFKTFSHRSLPLAECVAPVNQQETTSLVTAGQVAQEECTGDASQETTVVEKRKRGRPRIHQMGAPVVNRRLPSPPLDTNDENLALLVEKSRAAWKRQCEETDTSENSPLPPPREWFCRMCPTTVIYNDLEYNLHIDCHNMAQTNNSGKRFSCPLCVEVKKENSDSRRKLLECNDWNTMSSHLTSIHKVDMKLECPTCSVKLPNHLLFNKHTRQHKFKCSKTGCAFTSMKLKELSVHQLCHNDKSRAFTCHICGWSSDHNPNKWTLMHMHLTRTHPGTIDPLYKCPMCSKGFSEIRRYDTHVTSCKKLGKPLRPTCLVCGKAVVDSELHEHIQKHMTSKHWFQKIQDVLTNKPVLTPQNATKPEASANPTLTSESQDQDATNDVANDAETVVIDESNVIAQTSEAESNVENEEDLEDSGENKPVLQVVKPEDDENQEVKPPSGAKSRVKVKDLPDGGVGCKICYKKFANILRLNKHIARSHPTGGNVAVVCDTCGRSFRNKEQWRNHNRQVHLGMKRKHKSRSSRPVTKYHMCETCGYATPSAIRLRNHNLSQHMGIFPYSCTYPKCSYKTNEHSDLRRHMFKHTGIKPYACDHCDYKATQRWILVNHCLKQHNIQMSKRSHDTMGCVYSKKRLAQSGTRPIIIRNLVQQPNGDEEVEVEEGLSMEQYILQQAALEAEQQGEPQVIEIPSAANLKEEQYILLEGEEVSVDTEAVMLLANMASGATSNVVLQQTSEAEDNGAQQHIQ